MPTKATESVVRQAAIQSRIAKRSKPILFIATSKSVYSPYVVIKIFVICSQS